MEVEVLHSAAKALNRVLASASPDEIIAEAVASVPEGRLAVVSSFGMESAVLLKYVSDVDPAIPVLFLDTGWLFEETIAYRDRLTQHLGLTDVRSLKPDVGAVATQDPERDLWFRDTGSCCRIRKVDPLAQALRHFDAWLSGRKRFHDNERAHLPVVETDGRRLKFNPLAFVSKPQLDSLFDRFDLPRHPLQSAGFASVGCMPCTSRTQPGEAVRAGRWRGTERTECGIHDSRKY